MFGKIDVPNAADRKKLEDILSRQDASEQDLQDFLEVHPEFIPQVFLQNHGMHLQCIISKFPLDTSLVTDFVYLAKSSASWNIVLIELERHQKPLLVNADKTPTPSSELSGALAQVREWMAFIEDNKSEVLRRLSPIRVPLADRPVNFKYMLIIGKDREFSSKRSLQRALGQLNSETIKVTTYDGILRNYDNTRGPVWRPNILRVERSKYTIKRLHSSPWNLFAYVGPGDLLLTQEHENILERDGYNILAWRRGELLTGHEGKATATQTLHAMASMRSSS